MGRHSKVLYKQLLGMPCGASNRQNKVSAHYLSGFVHLTIWSTPGGVRRTPPLHLWRVISNWLAEGGARLLCLSIPRNPKVRQTFMGGPRESRLDESWQSWVRRWGRMGMRRRAGMHIVRLAALRRHNKRKLSNDSRARSSCL